VSANDGSLTGQEVVSRHVCRCDAHKEVAFIVLGLAAHDVLHVGDSLSSDVAGARAAGIAVLWVNRKRRAAAETIAAEYVAQDLSGLPAVFAAQRRHARIEIERVTPTLQSPVISEEH
jgi:hypothetical protein